MKKLSEFKDDEAMDVLAEIIDPMVNMMKNKKFVLAMRGNRQEKIKPNRVEAIKIAITDNRSDVVKIMAVLNETPVEEFHYNLLTLPQMMVEMFNDKELMDFFGYQSEKDSQIPFGSVTENTEESQDTSSDM